MPDLLKAPPCCPNCMDEADCSHVQICRAVAEVHGEPVDEPTTDQIREAEVRWLDKPHRRL